MPIPAILAPLAANVIGNVVNQVRYKKMQQYNSPKAQAERWRQAGYSPNAMFTGADSGNMQEYAQFEIPDVAGMIESLSAAETSKTTGELQQAQRDNTRFDLAVKQGIPGTTQTPAGRKFGEEIRSISSGTEKVLAETVTEGLRQIGRAHV